jgi:hypothetical protein
MFERTTERHTLHFDLTHCGHDLEYTLCAHGVHYPLLRHTEESRAGHRARNGALALIPDSHSHRITHYIEEIELSGDSVGMHSVTYPSADPDAPLPELALVFIHVPLAARQLAARRRAARGTPQPHPLVLDHLGAAAIPWDAHPDTHLHAQNVHTPIAIAKSIVLHHPDLASLKPEITAHVLDTAIEHALRERPGLIQFISRHPRKWYQNQPVSFNGEPMTPAEGLTDKLGNPVVWPKLNGRSVIWQRHLPDDLLEAAKPAVQLAVQHAKADAALQGQIWTMQHGATCRTKPQTQPQPQPHRHLLGGALPDVPRTTESGPHPGRWSINFQTSQFGLDLDTSSLHFDPSAKKLSFQVKNWANRSLGVYVQFLDSAGRPINNPPNWEDRTTPTLTKSCQPNPSKKYLQMITPGNTVFGVPVPTDYYTIDFPVPDDATECKVLLGGLGHGGRDDDVDLPGIVYTCVLNYGVPSLMLAMSVGLQSTSWYMGLMADSEMAWALLAVGLPIFGATVGVGAVEFDTKMVLARAGEFVAGIIFSAGLSYLARRVLGYATTEQLMESAPFVGWVLRIASCAAALDDMIATSIDVARSPATYSIDLKRSMDVTLTVHPDPIHGVGDQPPIWPQVATDYEVVMRYQTGTYYTVTGAIPDQNDLPLEIHFNNVPTSPHDNIQFTVHVYSTTGWLAGHWTSGWTPAVPNHGEGLVSSGSIIESLVPLTANTQYSHRRKLVYDAQNGHAWRIGPAPSQTQARADSSDTDGQFRRLVQTTINDRAYVLGYTYRVAGQNLPLDNGDTPTDVQMYGFQCVSVLGHPEAAMKAPTRGFSSRPFLVFDQFGPAPLFSTSLARQPELDNGWISLELYTAFSEAGTNYQVPAGATATVVTPGVEWSIGLPGQPPLYELKLAQSGSNSLIQVLRYFGAAFLFSVPSTFGAELDHGTVSDALKAKFAAASTIRTLPPTAKVTVVTPTAEWTIGLPGQAPLYTLRRNVDSVEVFPAPSPLFSRRNFWLDPRDSSYFHLRGVTLLDGVHTFDLSTGKSFGKFAGPNLDALVVHPNGYVIAADYTHHKMHLLTLQDSAVADGQSRTALPMSGLGAREGLLAGPVAMTVTPDGRILVLEQDNNRIQAFDAVGNPVPCFKGWIQFTLAASFATDLDSASISIGLIQEFQRHIKQILAPLLWLPASQAQVLDVAQIDEAIRQAFAHAGITLSAQAKLHVTTPGAAWLLEDAESGLNYDIRLNTDLNLLDVTRAARLFSEVKAHGTKWLVRDTANSRTFEISLNAQTHQLSVQQLVATMKLRDIAGQAATYLDVAVETKSFIYVLYYVNQGLQTSDYRLDIYSPDGSFLAGTPRTDGAPGVNGGKISVDQWRNLYTLNYETFHGPNNRIEPSASIWIPST